MFYVFHLSESEGWWLETGMVSQGEIQECLGKGSQRIYPLTTLYSEVKVCFYNIVQYPLRWNAQSTLHFTPWQTYMFIPTTTWLLGSIELGRHGKRKCPGNFETAAKGIWTQALVISPTNQKRRPMCRQMPSHDCINTPGEIVPQHAAVEHREFQMALWMN